MQTRFILWCNNFPSFLLYIIYILNIHLLNWMHCFSMQYWWKVLILNHPKLFLLGRTGLVKLKPFVDNFAQMFRLIQPVCAENKEHRKENFLRSLLWNNSTFSEINDCVYLGAGRRLNCKGQPTQADLNHRSTERGPVLFLFFGKIAAGRPETACRWTSFISFSQSAAIF